LVAARARTLGALALVASAAGDGGMALDPSQVHAVLGLEQGVALAPPTVPSSPFMVYLAGLLADPSKGARCVPM